MCERLVIDDMVHWAKTYKASGPQECHLLLCLRLVTTFAVISGLCSCCCLVCGSNVVDIMIYCAGQVCYNLCNYVTMSRCVYTDVCCYSWLCSLYGCVLWLLIAGSSSSLEDGLA